jgi:insulysin
VALQDGGTVVATAAAAGLAAYAVESAPLDPRSYRGLILPNGMRILLASDPTAAKGAASMNVQVGYMSDPANLPGLAHFCEHMLFLGTEAFPDEGAFERAVASAGGSNNAYTAAEETNYYFDVQGDALPEALERFAAFFSTPLFTQSATAREVNAIESEHSKNLQSDLWRYEQLLKLRCDPSHPYAKFGTGNRETLDEGDARAREALLSFHGRYYQADQMSLALVGPQRLDALQKLAVRNFAAVPSSPAATTPRPLYASSTSSAEYDALPLPFRPAESAPEVTLMVPVNELRTLKLVWCVPVTDLKGWVESKPDELWQLLMSNRANGGLLPYLKRKGFAIGLGASVEDFTRSFALLSVSIDLTPLGLTKWRAVSSLLFGYIRMLSERGVPASLVRELRSLARTSFEYAEPTEPENLATSASPSLPFYEPGAWVSGPATVGAGGEVGCGEMLSHCMEPANALITLVSAENANAATLTEPIYGTRYGTLPIRREVEAWRKAAVPEGLYPPQPNPFIPSDFSIKCGGNGGVCTRPKLGATAPLLLADAPGQRVHFLQDETFQRPKAFAFFLFRSDVCYTSPATAITAQLFQAMLADTLQDATYQASLAGLGAGIGAEFSGLMLTASGYNARLPDLVEYVAGEVRTAHLTPLAFERQREAIRQQLANFDRKQPVSLCSYQRSLALLSPRFAMVDLKAAVEGVTLADVQAFQRGLLPNALLEALFIGNLDAADANRMVKAVSEAIPVGGALPADRIPRRQVRVLPVGRTLRQYAAPNDAEINSATEVFLQIGPDVGDDWLLLAVFAQILDQPFYAELRTNQQLGYIVQSGVSENDGVRGLAFSVQSSVLPPPEVEQRIDAFLASFRGVLSRLSEPELGSYRDALASQATDVDKRLGAQAGRLWTEITQRRYDYGRPWRTARRLRKVTKGQLLDFFDRFIAPGGAEQRRLATHIFAKKAAPAALVVEPVPSDYYSPPPDRAPGGAAAAVV